MTTEGAVSEAGVDEDPFSLLFVGTEGAKVSMTVGRSLEYGEVKCSATVSVSCPQGEAFINKAAEISFKKALELVNDGMSHLAPGLPPIEYSQ